MAEGLDEIVQKVLLEGDVEILHQLAEIGEGGLEAFHEIAEAAEQGASKMALFATSVALVTVAFVGAAGAVAAFAEQQAEAIQQTNLLAKSFGATTAQITGIEAAFAAAGVSTTTFEQFASRLTTTIAREWPSIAESIRTASTEQTAAQDRVVASTLRVQDAQRNLGNVNQDTSSKVAAANARVEQTFTALQFSAQKALQTIQHDLLAVQGASQGVEAAEQRLATLQGRPPSESEKKNLELAEAALAVDKARQAQSDARLKQQQDQAEAAAKQAAAEQAASDAQVKRDLVIQESLNARAKAELQLREAVVSRQQAEEKANQAALRSIPAISQLVQNLIAGQKAADQAIDITQVKVQDLGKGIIAAASVAGKQPTGLQTMIELSKLLSSEQGKLLDSAQRLAIVQQLGQQRMQSVGIAASELLNVLSRGPSVISKFENAASQSFGATEQAAHNVEHFKDALTGLSFSIDLVNRSLSAAALPLFTHALEAITESLTKQGGLLHAFVSGITAIGAAIGTVIHWFQELFAWIDKTFNLEPGRAFQVFIIALTVLVGAFASAWLAIPAIIAVVVTAIGYVVENMDKVKKVFAETWAAIQDTGVYKFLKGIVDILTVIVGLVAKAGKWLLGGGDGKATAGTNAAQNGTDPNSAAPPISRAGGGPVAGKGTKTSDSIPANLSHGEFVHQAAAVDFWGADFMHSINNMEFPGFASGGPVSPGARPGNGQGAPKSQSVLNLTIGDQEFPGLRGPTDVVDSLAHYAIGRRTASAGRAPSWVGGGEV